MQFFLQLLKYTFLTVILLLILLQPNFNVTCHHHLIQGDYLLSICIRFLLHPGHAASDIVFCGFIIQKIFALHHVLFIYSGMWFSVYIWDTNNILI